VSQTICVIIIANVLSNKHAIIIKQKLFAFNILHLDLGMNQKKMGKGQELRVIDIFLHAHE